MHWLPFPFVRFTIALMLGIILGHSYPSLQGYSLGVSLGCFLLYLGCFFLLRKHKSESLQILLGLIGLSGLFSFGVLLTHEHNDLNDPKHYTHQKGQYLYATIIHPPVPKPKSIQLTIKIHRVSDPNQSKWIKSKGKAIIYVPYDYKESLKMGAGVILPNQLEDIPPPSNPYAFDYRAYIGPRNIRQSKYVPKIILAEGHLTPLEILQKASYKARDFCYHTLLVKLKSQKEASLVAALAFGIKDHLSEDLSNAYRGAGLAHILAVSGLHVGLIYLIMLNIFERVIQRKKNKQRVAIGHKRFLMLLVLVLGSYAFLTGLSPSVLRASLMFVLIQASMTFVKDQNTYNSLAVSAFVLLLIDPLMLYQIGFQLSYLAVLGIVYFFPKLNSLWTPNHRLTRWAFEATMVSLSAQITTLPLSIYYFHQYPLYGFLANLLVVPAGFVILVGGLSVVALSWIPLFSDLLGWLLRGMVWLTNSMVEQIESWSFSKLSMSIGEAELVLWFLLLIIIMMLLERRRFVYVRIGIGVTLLWIGVKGYKYYEQYQQHKVMIYDTPKHNNLVMIEGTKAFLLADSLFFEEPKSFKYNLQNHFLRMGIRDTTSMVMTQNTQSPIGTILSLPSLNMVYLDGMTLGLLSQRPTDKELAFLEKSAADYIIIQNKSVYNLEMLKDIVTDKALIILGSSVPDYLRQSLHEQAQKAQVKLWDIHRDGALDLVEYPRSKVQQ